LIYFFFVSNALIPEDGLLLIKMYMYS
jgi:hypothetical protein